MLTNKSVRISTSWLSCLFPIKWAGLGCDHMPVLLTAWPLLCLTGALVNFAFCNNNNCKHVTWQDLRLQVSFSKRWSCQVVGLFKSHSMQSESYHQLVGSADRFRWWEKIWSWLSVHQPSVFPESPGSWNLEDFNVSTYKHFHQLHNWLSGSPTWKVDTKGMLWFIGWSCSFVLWSGWGLGGLMKCTEAVARYIWFTDAVNSK